LAKHAAGGEQLDDRRADGDLLACGAAHRVRAVGDAAELQAVAPGDRDAARGSDDARALERAALDQVRELDDHRTVRAEVAHRRYAAADREARVAECLQYRGGLALPYLGVEVGAPVERQMRMAIDETRYGEAASGLCRSRFLALRGLRHARTLADPRDLAVFDDDRRVGDRARAIEEPVDLQDRAHRVAVSSTDAASACRASSRARIRDPGLRRRGTAEPPGDRPRRARGACGH